MAKHELATFAGGCFWCMVSPFDEFPGVVKVVSGYTGGHQPTTYEQVCAGGPARGGGPDYLRPKSGLKPCWRCSGVSASHRSRGQFCDQGSSYRTAIFYHTRSKGCRRGIKQALAESSRFVAPIVTQFCRGFWPPKITTRASTRRTGPLQELPQSSGRDEFIQEHWSWNRSTALKERLTDIQYPGSRKTGRNRLSRTSIGMSSGRNLWISFRGSPFSSGTNSTRGAAGPALPSPCTRTWLKLDKSHGMVRTECEASADSPGPCLFRRSQGGRGLRYCINSAALRFIPKEDMEKEGYGNTWPLQG